MKFASFALAAAVLASTGNAFQAPAMKSRYAVQVR